MSGSKFVVVILGCVAAVAGLVLAGFLLFEPEEAPCATGDLAMNPFVDGQFQARNETFDSVEEAEAFICHDVPELHAEGWELDTVSAERTVPTEFLVEGEGLAIVSLSYANAEIGRTLTLDATPFFSTRSYFEEGIPSDATTEEVTVSGSPATVYRFGINPNQPVIIWREGTLEHRATTQVDDALPLSEVIAVLDTLE